MELRQETHSIITIDDFWPSSNLHDIEEYLLNHALGIASPKEHPIQIETKGNWATVTYTMTSSASYTEFINLLNKGIISCQEQH